MLKSIQLSMFLTGALAVSCQDGGSRLSQGLDAIDHRDFDAALQLIDDSLRNVEVNGRKVDLIADFEYQTAKNLDLAPADGVFNQDQVRNLKRDLQKQLMNAEGRVKASLDQLAPEILKFDASQFRTHMKLMQGDFGPDGKFYVHGLVYDYLLEKAGKPTQFLRAIKGVKRSLTSVWDLSRDSLLHC